MSPKRDCSTKRVLVLQPRFGVNPFSTAVPLWGQNSLISCVFPPKRDWTPRIVNILTGLFPGRGLRVASINRRGWPSVCCRIVLLCKILLIFLAAVVRSVVLSSRRGEAEGVEEAKGDPPPPREAVGRPRCIYIYIYIEEKRYRRSRRQKRKKSGSQRARNRCEPF